MTACLDCPDLMLSELPEGTVQRPRCCRDEHIDRRLAGSFDPWEGIEKARAASAEEEGRKSRQVRRAEERARAKSGGRS